MKNGFRVMDSDLHTMEPDGLWERYLDEPFTRFAPRFERRPEQAPKQPIITIGALALGEMSKRPREAAVGKSLHHRAFARSPHYEVAHARSYDAESHVQAMDIEGIDVAVLYGTRGRQVLMHDDLAPSVADARARAHNNWTADYCQFAPAPRGGSGASMRRGRSSAPARRCRSRSSRGSISSGSAMSPRTPTRRGSARGWRPWATEAINEFVALEGVSDKTKAKILWDNCARLYSLG